MFPHSGLADADHDKASGSAQPAVLRRAPDYIEQNAGADIGVADIAAAARIGARGLQVVFRRHRARTPLGELRRARIACALDELATADPPVETPSPGSPPGGGSRYPGRFSVAYRQAYQRFPSQTLRE